MVHEFSRSSPTPPPSCERCHTAMTWYRATLRSSAPKTITHFYACSGCDAVSTVDSVKGDAQAPQVFATARDADSAVWLAPKRKASE